MTKHGAVAVVQESEEETITSQMFISLEQLVMRIQGEYAFNVGCKGFKWDVTNGGANPTGAAPGTTTNRDKAMAEHKNLAGVRSGMHLESGSEDNNKAASLAEMGMGLAAKFG
jgi:hypothetical protein